MNRWNVTSTANATFVLLPPNIKPQNILSGFDAFKKKYLSEKEIETDNYSLLPLTSWHNDTRYEYMTYTTGEDTILIFALIGLVILIVASINFVNLSVAQAVKRSKEVGVRKVLGAHRLQLIRQYMSESINYTLISIILAFLLAWLLVPELNKFLANGIKLSLFDSRFVPIFLVGMFVLVSLLTGIYPAVFLSRFNPVESFKNKLNTKKSKGYSVRDSLVGIQFIIAQALIVSVLVISSQLNLIKNKDLGFSKEQIINVYIPKYDESKCETLRNQLLANPNIQNVSYSFSPPSSQQIMQTYAAFNEGGERERDLVQLIFIDENFQKTFDIKLLAGDFLPKYIEGDTLYKFIINKSFLKKMGFANPMEAINQPIEVSRYKGNIIGVTKNFNVRSLHETVPPVILTNFGTNYFSNMSVKISPNNVPATLDYIKQNWEAGYPEYIYDMQFYNEYLGSQYDAENKIFTIIEIFAVLSIIIGCLGLLGLMSFIAAQKTKEIGIRKVLGASEINILVLLSKQFSKVVLIANIIAWPVAWYLMNRWLENFAYRIELTLWIFLLAGIIGLIIAIISVSLQAIKAALANPVDSLKYE
ncbi:MAG: FtsX-like permease family protein [Ignavibacteria bacterium]